MKLTVTLSVNDIAQALLRHLRSMGAEVDENGEASVVFEYDAENQLTGATLAVESFKPLTPAPARAAASVEPYKPAKAAKPKPRPTPSADETEELSPEEQRAELAELEAQSRRLEQELAAEPTNASADESQPADGSAKPYVMDLGRYRTRFLGEGRAYGVEPPIER